MDDVIDHIQGRELSGSWRTWYGKKDNGVIDKVAFFQRMRHKKSNGKHPWILCIGFHPDLVDDSDDATYTNLLDKFSSRGSDFGLYSFVKNCMEKDKIFVVELPEDSDHRRPEGDSRHPKGYDAKRDKLLRLAINYYQPQNGKDWHFHYAGKVNHRHWQAPGDGPCNLYKFKQRR